MITLTVNSPLQSLQVISDTKNTNECPIMLTYVNINPGILFSPSSIPAQFFTNSGTQTILTAPASPNYYDVKYMSVFNADVIQRTITFNLNYNANNLTLYKCVLQVGDSVVYTNGAWKVTDVNGNVKQTNSFANQSANTVFAGPSSGSAAQPSFRSMVAADMPNAGVATGDLSGTWPSLTVANAVPRINLLTNPHGIVFQRGAKTIVNATANYGVDRWKGILSATTVTAGTWGQKTSAPNGSTGFAHGMLSASWTGAASLKYRQGVEAKDGCKFASQTAIFSANIYQDTGSAVTVAMNVYYQNTDDAWDGNSSNITLIGGASTSVASGGSGTVINSGALSIPSNAVHGLVVEISVAALGTGLTTKNFYVTAAQLQLGSIVTTCEERAYQEELARCQRYFYAWPDAAVNPGWGNGMTSTTSATDFYMRFPVTMRIPPSVTASSTGDSYNATDAVATNQAITGTQFNAANKYVTTEGVRVGNCIGAGTPWTTHWPVIVGPNGSGHPIADADF